MVAGGLTGLGAAASAPLAGPFPIGIYGVDSTNDFPVLREVGFNLVVGPAEQDYLEAARVQGLRVLARVDSSVTSRTIRKLDRHPALWAWHVFDEPDLHLVPPATLSAARKTWQRSGMRKPTALVINQGYEVLNYGDIPDILMVDRYPVPWLPVANLGQHVKMARLGVGKEKPLIAVIQAFDWSAYPGLLRVEEELRPPNLEEMRCMAYDALARGANGLFFYEYAGRWRIREHEEVWQALVSVVREVNDRLPLFEGVPCWWPRRHQFADAKTRFNEALESSVSSALLRVNKGSPKVPSGKYVLCVNNTAKEVVYSFSLPPAAGEGGRGERDEKGGARQEGRGENGELGEAQGVAVLGEQRSLEPISGWVADSFAPYGVHVYGPLP